jgi:NADPH:quinone reductase-like Zn-dependent oxidoreductase
MALWENNAMLLPGNMAAVQLVGHGGFDKLRYSEAVPVPQPSAGEVLIRVAAAGINNTDINTRIGWYSAKSSESTEAAIRSGAAPETGDWSGAGLAFPRIQGADVCGHIVKVGSAVPVSRLGERVIVQSCLRSLTQDNFTPWLGSERDGGFAQLVCAPALDTYHVACELSDAELAAVPCAYGTAENLISRAGLSAGETVLITGASGNVGLAAIQLAKRRKAQVIAIAAREKFRELESIGADRCIARGDDLIAALRPGSIDVAIDVVGGPQWPGLLDLLKTRGRYAVSGAIAGPMVDLDLRKLYLKDLTFFGGTAQDANVFPDLVGYLRRGEIRPLVSNQYALREIVAAQEDFLSKKQIGKIILVPPPVAS